MATPCRKPELPPSKLEPPSFPSTKDSFEASLQCRLSSTASRPTSSLLRSVGSGFVLADLPLLPAPTELCFADPPIARLSFSFFLRDPRLAGKVVIAIFFREIRPRGAFNIPRDGPVLFVAAPHHNQVRLLPPPPSCLLSLLCPLTPSRTFGICSVPGSSPGRVGSLPRDGTEDIQHHRCEGTPRSPRPAANVPKADPFALILFNRRVSLGSLSVQLLLPSSPVRLSSEPRWEGCERSYKTDFALRRFAPHLQSVSVEQPTWPSQAPERSPSILTTPRSSEESVPSSTSSSPLWRRSSLVRRSGTRRLSSKRSGATRKSSESSTCGSCERRKQELTISVVALRVQVEDGAGHQGLDVGEVGDGPGSRARCSGAYHNLVYP